MSHNNNQNHIFRYFLLNDKQQPYGRFLSVGRYTCVEVQVYKSFVNAAIDRSQMVSSAIELLAAYVWIEAQLKPVSTYFRKLAG